MTTTTLNEVVNENMERLTKKINMSAKKVINQLVRNIQSVRKRCNPVNDVSPSFVHDRYQLQIFPTNKCVGEAKVEVIERSDKVIPIMFRVTFDKIANDNSSNAFLRDITIHRIRREQSSGDRKLSETEKHLLKNDLGFYSQADVIMDFAFYSLGFDIDARGWNNDDTQLVVDIYFPPEDIVKYPKLGRPKVVAKANTPEWFKKKFATM